MVGNGVNNIFVGFWKGKSGDLLLARRSEDATPSKGGELLLLIFVAFKFANYIICLSSVSLLLRYTFCKKMTKYFINSKLVRTFAPTCFPRFP
jgi:hypothetical protein